MEKVKVICTKTLAVKEIEKNLLNDYIGTKEYVIYKETKAEDTKVKKPLKQNVK